MNSYTKFARLYDSLMDSDVDYEKWADYIENLFDKYDKNYFFWRNSQSEELIYHFEMFIKPHLS